MILRASFVCKKCGETRINGWCIESPPKDDTILTVLCELCRWFDQRQYCELLSVEEGFTKTIADDPDGPLVPLPVRIPHRYGLLGFTSNKFGEH